jgi:hypothetical protein
VRTLDQAIADEAVKPFVPQLHYSHFQLEVTREIDVLGRKERRTEKTPWRHNLTTDAATGYTNRRDWQAKAMGQGPSFAFASATGTATASAATSLTNTGATFPTAGQALAGSIVVMGAAYGVVLSNTATVLTIDQWYNPASTSGASTTTPTAGVYVILPGQNPASWLALTADATAPATTDTTLTSELTTNGFARAVGSYAHTAAATTYTLQKLFTATGAATINKEAVLGAATGGVMPFESAETSPPALVSGDTLTQTITVTIN